jgi:hypothetical protein
VGLGEAAVEHGAAGERRSRVLALGIPIDGAEPRGLGRLVRATRSTKCGVEDDRQTRWG